MVREGRVLSRTSGRPTFGVGFSVVVLEPGGQASAASSGTTITAAGHGFASGDYLIVGLDVDTYRHVQSVTTDTIEVDDNTPISIGDLLVNLGADTGSNAPDYLGSGVTIYTDPVYATQVANATVQTGDDGWYRYYHQGVSRWELALDEDQAPYAIYTDTNMDEDDRVSYEIRYAHLFATGGSGTEADPWVTAGSNPIQAALNDLPSTGGTVHRVPGVYELGSADPAVSIPVLADTLDKRGYAFTGDGRDLVFENYSGTGTAYRYEGNSFQSNQLVFRGFSLRQTGTPRTGNAFWGSYISESLFEDMNIGCVRMDRQSGEPDTGFEYGIKIVATTGSHVADFNRFHRLYCNGNSHAIYIDNQGDNTVISECSFEPRQLDSGATDSQDGVEIHNSYGVTVSACHFNYFGKASNNSAFGGLRISGNANGTVISGNYFEANYPYNVNIYPSGYQRGISIVGNSFSFSASTSTVGIFAGVDLGSFNITGLNISGNGFFLLSATNVGISIRDNVTAFTEGSNGFDNTGGTNRVLQRGCRGLVFNGFTDNNVRPILYLVDTTQNQGRVYLENTSTSAEASPSVQFKPGGSGARPSGLIYVDSAGAFTFLSDSGVAQFSVSQTGDVTGVGQLRRSVAAAITASTTHTQAGATALTKDINNVSVCANADDAVTLPTAVAGMQVVVMNNGAQNLRIWPAPGDNLGTGVDTVRGALAAGSNVRFTSYDATNWEEI